MVRNRWGALAELGFGRLHEFRYPLRYPKIDVFAQTIETQWINHAGNLPTGQKPSDMTDKPPASLTPVIAGSGALGCILFSCRGYKAFNARDELIGIFASPGEAAAAILAAPST